MTNIIEERKLDFDDVLIKENLKVSEIDILYKVH